MADIKKKKKRITLRSALHQVPAIVNKPPVKQKKKYLSALEVYLKFKKKYDSKQKKLKKLIIKKDISWEERRRELQRRTKCLNCGAIGGTHFSNKNGYYTAICKGGGSM